MNAEAEAPGVWEHLPRDLRRIVCMQRSPTPHEAIDLVARGLAVEKPGGVLGYTELGFAVRFHGFHKHKRLAVN